MAEKKIKHLEFIQNIITRMNSNSFLIKGWTITLISALFVLAANGSDVRYVLITYVPLPIFWILDGFYISQERKYRDLYHQVAQTDESQVDFSLDASGFKEFKNSWTAGVFSKTLIPFYGISIIITLVVMSLIQ